jgi:aldose 1-epimerase
MVVSQASGLSTSPAWWWRSKAVTEENGARQTGMSITDAVHPSVRHDTVEGFEAVTLAAGALEATFVPSLGMVGASLRHAGEELLDRRAGLRAYRDMGTVMGVPLLHPWANRLARDELILDGHRVRLPGPPSVWRDEHGLPIHGLLGAHPGWSVHEADADGHVARLRAGLDFAADPRLTALFPFPHDLMLEATLSAGSLRIATTLRATGAVAVPIAFGYHPYLRIPRVSRADWHVHLPARRHLELDELAIPAGGGSRESAADFRLGDASFDDGYDAIDDGAVFAVAGGGREIRVSFDAGFPAAQVFSPTGAPYICFEPMTARTNALCSGVGLRHVAPGDAFTAVYTIGVS